MPKATDASKFSLKRTAAKRMVERYDWHKIEAPVPWYPECRGDELVGYFGGTTMRKGSHGEYTAAIVHAPGQGSYLVSGALVLQRIDSAMVQKGDPLRIQFLGWVDIGSDRKMREFEVWTAKP